MFELLFNIQNQVVGTDNNNNNTPTALITLRVGIGISVPKIRLAKKDTRKQNIQIPFSPGRLVVCHGPQIGDVAGSLFPLPPRGAAGA